MFGQRKIEVAGKRIGFDFHRYSSGYDGYAEEFKAFFNDPGSVHLYSIDIGLWAQEQFPSNPNKVTRVIRGSLFCLRGRYLITAYSQLKKHLSSAEVPKLLREAR